MTIQKTLLDVLKQCGLAKIETIKITPTDGKLRIQTYDEDRVLFIDGMTHESFPGVPGEFGVQHFKTLKGLLNLTNFQTDSATLKIGVRDVAGVSYPDRLEFKGGGSKATFRLVFHEVVPEQPTIVNIPWDITMALSPSKLAEFQQMAGLYTDTETLFTLRSEDGDLKVDFGIDSASTHSGSMTLVEGANGELVSEMRFSIQQFLAVMKLANDAKESEIRLTSKGLLGVVVKSDHATYNYYLKKSVA